MGEGSRAVESTDGGMTWNVFDLPDRDDDAALAPVTRACGPAGCALSEWIRVGWGKPASADDLRPVDSPTAPYVPQKLSPTILLQCEVGASTTPPIAPPKKPVARPLSARGVVGAGIGKGVGVIGQFSRPLQVAIESEWAPFRNMPAPALAFDEIGIDNGPYADIVQMRAYAWGKRGADWTRAGRFEIRFDDRFDPTGGVRSSAISASPWSDEALAAEAIGSNRYGATNWSAYLDPSGRAILANACRQSTCSFIAVGEGQPLLPVRDPSGHMSSFSRPFANGAVRVGETWFFLSPVTGSDAVALWRADLGVARPIGTYYRSARYGLESPRMVRRAFGDGIGLLIGSGAEPGERAGIWYVLPANPETGELGEAIPLARRDLSGVNLQRCTPTQDGWLFDTPFESPTSVDLRGSSATIDNLEMRVRMDPGTVCIESLAARIDNLSD
jgi:hypothetical protein